MAFMLAKCVLATNSMGELCRGRYRSMARGSARTGEKTFPLGEAGLDVFAAV
jgi:hypothetical protein